MQTYFETGNDKLYIQIKKFFCPHKFATGIPISAKQALVVADFAVPALNMILLKCLEKCLVKQKNKTKQKSRVCNDQREIVRKL